MRLDWFVINPNSVKELILYLDPHASTPRPAPKKLGTFPATKESLKDYH